MASPYDHRLLESIRDRLDAQISQLSAEVSEAFRLRPLQGGECSTWCSSTSDTLILATAPSGYHFRVRWLNAFKLTGSSVEWELYSASDIKFKFTSQVNVASGKYHFRDWYIKIDEVMRIFPLTAAATSAISVGYTTNPDTDA